MTVFVNWKRLHPDAVVPTRATEGAAGFDLVATSININTAYVEYGTGLALQIPKGYVGYIHARSSISNTGWILCNGTGVGDPDFRGEYRLRFYPVEATARLLHTPPYAKGERIGQLVIVPCPQVVFGEKMDLDGTARGDGGFGSTGR